MRVVLVSTYELGRQPFGVGSAAAWLQREGAQVTCLDLAVEPLAMPALLSAALVLFYVPMHTATRLAAPLIARLRQLNPAARIGCFGLYAPVNEPYLRSLGAEFILGGEFEAGLAALYRRLATGDQGAGQPEAHSSLARQQFLPPVRAGLPPLERYAFLQLPGGERRLVGATEASRGCKHRCRHCPIVPVYGGQFRIVQPEVVLADIRAQVAAGAQHITFGDPDFLNGPGHALRVVEALHAEFPSLTYDVTIKIEHLLQHAALLPRLRTTGCVLVTSAVEAVDDGILALLDKRHTRADFITAVALLRDVGLPLNPTFVAFNPWISREGYQALLALLAELQLIEHVAPIQYAIRLLIPAGSRLLELPGVRALVQPFDPVGLCFPWAHPDPAMDALHARILALVRGVAARRSTRRELFQQVWAAAHDTSPVPAFHVPPAAEIPQLSEPWYC